MTPRDNHHNFPWVYLSDNGLSISLKPPNTSGGGVMASNEPLVCGAIDEHVMIVVVFGSEIQVACAWNDSRLLLLPRCDVMTQKHTHYILPQKL